MRTNSLFLAPRTFLRLGCLASIIYLAWQLAPRVLSSSNWQPYDYNLYVGWGRALREGHVTYSYPLPTIFWIFVPLSLLPSAFSIVFALVPFLFTSYLLGRRGFIVWLYYPLIVQAAFGQLDGWLILPFSWMLKDKPRWAAVGAVLLLTKPTLAPLAVIYVLVRWLRLRNWLQLRWFALALVVLITPAFIIDPLWLLHFIAQLHVRATETNMPTRGAALWAWAWHGGITLVLLPVLLLFVLILCLRLVRRHSDLLPLAEILNLLLLPFLYASNLTMLIPLLVTSRRMLIIPTLSWICVGIDVLAGGWGGAYALIPLSLLVLLASNDLQDLRHPTPEQKLRA